MGDRGGIACIKVSLLLQLPPQRYGFFRQPKVPVVTQRRVGGDAPCQTQEARV
ncbi:hypothetical protein [Paenibacillus sp. 3LSP]|uniref:hypothetical protein n=1 Tax=Paenibacillus sp. 3LSP TaxID=2800795 RepID=UPI0012FCE40A|nr:hypothetical protein [Paenibacillus sp. 3LSP]